MSKSLFHKLYFIEESTYGVTPATPALAELPVRSCTLALSQNIKRDGSMRADRMKRDSTNGTKQIGGDIVAEIKYGIIDALLEAAVCGTWASDILKTGKEKRSFTIVRHFTELDEYEVFTGVVIDTLGVAVPVDDYAALTFGCVGKSSSDTLPVGAVLEDATDIDAMDLMSGIAKEGGSAIGTITEVTVNIANGRTPRFVVDSLEMIEPGIGHSMITGQVSSYFENKTLLNKFKNGTKSSVSVTLADPAGNTLEIEMPRTHYTGGQADTAEESDIIVPLPFESNYDSAKDSTIVITRTAV